jgi:hypothetical protein
MLVVVLYATGSPAAVLVALLVLIPLGLVVTRIAEGVDRPSGRRDEGTAQRDRRPSGDRLPGGRVGRDRGDQPPEATPTSGRERDRRVRDGLARLRDRYAAGELDEDQFERKLETLLETETPEGARSYLDRSRDTPASGADEDGDGDETGERSHDEDRDPDPDPSLDRDGGG